MEILQSEGRFYIRTRHGEAELLYKVDGRIMSIYHTFVPGEERHRGIAESLTEEAFSLAMKKKWKVRPDCPYVVYFLGKHKELKKYSI